MSSRSRILIATAALALAVPTVATAAPASPHDDLDRSGTTGQISSAVRPKVLDQQAKVNVMVQLKGDPVAVAAARSTGTFSTAERTMIKKDLRNAQDAISDDITARGGKVLSHMQSAYNGMRVQIARGKAASLARLPGVLAVHAITARTLDNTVSVPYLGVPKVWQDTGYTGTGVKVAIIDTGIDYTHADFGGPGTTEAFTAAAAASTQDADPALFGPAAPRVKGGHDFVGDDYDPGAAAGSPALTPRPDSNPLDCNGHGSHVAGTTGGSGVTTDGKTYAGPYNAATPNTEFNVGPGVAPQVDLYALRVFGCEGSTDVVAEAIDWAVDHQMDVINMSLGGPFGRSGDPDATAASNAVGAGVVVVASAGNSGGNPYITGSPAAGQGVISVAAIDSTASFPGAKLTFGNTSVQAINANGAQLPAGDFKMVALTDDPNTTENESLGCSVEAYSQSGIDADPSAAKQVAVVNRGTCARAAKPVFGQQAGADAVVMINNSTDLPPYEGPITSNPDDGTPFNVTIPFLGVPSTSGPALLAAAEADELLSLSKATLDNPAYNAYASFSSGGPVNGDSGLSPNISAPGVSIASAGVGTGSGAAIFSGTSMAAPHVTGVAALGVQAHPTWSAHDVAATLLSTSDPERVKGYRVTLGGGLVDAAQTVTTQAFATGDSFRTKSGRGTEATLSFGFAEPMKSFVSTRVVTLHNQGTRTLTYTVRNEKSAASRPASVRFSRNKVKVRPGHTETVRVKLRVRAGSIGSSLADDQFGFKEVSGNITLTSGAGKLRVPYLLVPRAQANVTASAKGSRGYQGSSLGKAPSTQATVKLANRKGALGASADFYTWGLSDPRDVSASAGGSGYDLRAAGVQSWDDKDGKKVLVFAVNNHDRWSTAATQEFDVSVDTNKDGTPDFVLFSYDSGFINTGDYNGVTEVFYQEVATGKLFGTGYLAVAPTDSSTILLPVDAAAFGLTPYSGGFTYTVGSFTAEDAAAQDEFNASASYDPWAKAITDGDYVTVRRNHKVYVKLALDRAKLAAQQPKGSMVVVFDNKSGAREALLLGIR